MPHINKTEGEEVMRAILAIKGKASAKQRVEHKNGKLRIKGGSLRYSKVMDPIEAVTGPLELRTHADAAEVIKHEGHQKPLIVFSVQSAMVPKMLSI